MEGIPSNRPKGQYVMAARLFTVLYFGFFRLMPLYSKIDQVKVVPERLTRQRPLPDPAEGSLAPAARPLAFRR